MEELEKLVKPICEWIEKNGNPYMQIVISLDNVRVTEDVSGIPIDRN